jgi:glycosyltransferase involved in cell wall biosynthesis
MENPKATAIVPCLNEEDGIDAFYERTSGVLERLFGEHWEIVFVDDGSTDRTVHAIKALRERDPRVRCVRLSRNFGSHVAIAAGLDHAEGDLAVVLAADLQDPPEVIEDLVAKWREGYEVVWAAREAREDPLMRKLFARVFYGAIVRTALPSIPRTGTGSFCLIDRAVIEAFKRFPERNRLTFGIIAWSGFSQTQVPYERAQRHAGSSKWSFGMLVKTAIDTFVSFSYVPLRFISYFGFVVSVLAFLFGIYVGIDYVVNGTGLRGWPSLMGGILFFGGVQMLTLGIVGEYIWRISEESKRRPLYLVRERVGVEDPGEVHPR